MEARVVYADDEFVASGGYRVIVNNGSDACQTVGHLHVHVLGGARMSHGMVSLQRPAGE